MPITESTAHRQSIPILYTRGTHYEVGFDIGRNFASMIHSFLESCQPLHEKYFHAYETPEGRKAYEDTLFSVKSNFPQYVDELQGTADGAKLSFHQLFLLHVNDIILDTVKQEGVQQLTGCSDICLNREGQEILGHTEDALKETINHFYLVSAHIISDKPQGRWNVTEEKFTSLCYAGHLPGYTMSYNHHGLVFSINTICPKNLVPGKTPCYFLLRALLSAENFEQAHNILKDRGAGAADGCGVNITFLQEEGERIFRNIEVGPPSEGANETQLDIVSVNRGEHFVHCNSYLRLPVEQISIEVRRSTEARLSKLQKYDPPKSENDVIEMLSDTSNKEYPVFRHFGPARTIAVGIFNCVKRNWTLYSDNPKQSEPLVVLPLMFKTK